MAEETLPVSEFLLGLAQRNEEYQLIGQPSGHQAQIRFTGSFEATDIIWDAHIEALGTDANARQFIDIAASGYPLRRITIGLAVAAIDRPVLLKTIIMIRNYKRLRAGRHEFGGPRRKADE